MKGVIILPLKIVIRFCVTFKIYLCVVDPRPVEGRLKLIGHRGLIGRAFFSKWWR